MQQRRGYVETLPTVGLVRSIEYYCNGAGIGSSHEFCEISVQAPFFWRQRVIRFDQLESQQVKLAQAYSSAKPYAHVIIDDFCDEGSLSALLDQIPTPEEGNINKSRDYVFASNKFEKSNFRELGALFDEVYQDLISDRFRSVMGKIVGADVWVDPEFHGGGIHQGGEGSFLDMHADFSHHPLHSDWEREINILLYLNRDWQPEYRGQLELRNKDSGEAGCIEPLFNRCVIMQTKGHTLHGYGKINFPANVYRRSIATYAYKAAEAGAKGRSTVWFPEEGGMLKRAVGQNWPKLVAIKTRLFGSGTSRNR